MFEEDEKQKEAGFFKKAIKYLGPILAILFLILKFGSKLKFIIGPLLKFFPVLLKTGSTMILTIWVYSVFYGWYFAAGFVLLILIHEFGHLIMAKIMKLDVSWPVFIPFLGAFIALKEAPRHAWIEFWVAAGGPIMGGLAAAVCHYIYFLTGNVFFAALAYTGYFLNLFNLMPTGFLDGGRMVTALSPWLWVVGIAIAAYFMYLKPHFLVFLIILFSLPRIFSLFKKKTDEEKRFYEVTAIQRLTAAGIYFGLIFLLGFGMFTAYVEPPNKSSMTAANISR